jgi:hypothetical protein
MIFIGAPPPQPVYAPSAIAARGGKFRELPGRPGYVTVSQYLCACDCQRLITSCIPKPTAIPDPWTIVAQFKQAAINAKEAGFDGVECMLFHCYILPASKNIYLVV